MVEKRRRDLKGSEGGKERRMHRRGRQALVVTPIRWKH